MAIQLEGNITLGGNDHADDVYALRIRGTRERVVKDGTFADSSKTTSAGSAEYEVECEFDADEGDATGVWLEFWTAFTSATGELAFSGNITTGATSATNPQFTGTLLVTSIEAMGKVGDDKRVTLTLPANGVLYATS